MNRITKTTLCCMVLGVLSLSLALECVIAAPTPGDDAEISIDNRQNDITIACPTQISYRIEANPQWDAGMHGLKILPFEDASVSGRMLTCNYSVNKSSVKDSSFLTREMPAGYICKSERIFGAKNWMFTCKRAIAPIKVKPKS